MSSTLLVPVPEAEDALARWWPLWDPPRARGIAAHVSVCFPFLRRRELTETALVDVVEAVASVPRFTARFDRVGRFPATVFLAPDPAQPFVALMRAVRERFPDHRPRRHDHHGLVPHLTVLTCPDDRLLDEAAAAAEAAPPIVSAVTEVWLLVEHEHGPWTVERQFPLGR